MLSHFCCVRLFATLPTVVHLCPWDSSGKNTGMGCHFLLQGIFLTQELNLSLLSLALAGEFFATSATWVAKAYLKPSRVLTECKDCATPGFLPV